VTVAVAKSVQLRVADDESYVARTLGNEFVMAVLVVAVHSPENPLQDSLQPGFLPLGPGLMVLRLPENSPFHVR